MTARRSPPNRTWGLYLQRFHAEHPGITERILSRCHAGGLDPYQWCAQPLAGQAGPVLDLACGSGPMADRLHGWIGADTSVAELDAARDRQRSPVMRASATCLPVRADAVDAATCSMGLQIIDPIAEALTELARVLRPRGMAALLLPAGGPVPWRQAVIYGHLQVALRQRIRYPNDGALRPVALRQATTRVGLQVSHDERLAFTLPLDTAADAAELLASLYLPGIGPARLDAGRRVLEGAVGRTLTVPLRRVLLERTEAAA
jgi:SAM-dependent methyltransferase